MKALSKKERNLFVADYIRTTLRLFVVVAIFYLTGFYYFRDYFFAIYVFLVLVGAAFSIYFIYFEITCFKPLLVTKLKDNESIPFIFCAFLINALFIYAQIFFFGEFYKNLILIISLVLLTLITTIYCAFYYYRINKKLKSYYENLLKDSLKVDTEHLEKTTTTYLDQKHHLDKETSSLFLYMFLYYLGIMCASLISTLFAHFYSQGNEELLITIFVSPLIIFLFFIPFPIIIYKKSINIQKTYAFLNIFNVFYQYIVFFMTPFIYGSLENPNFGYMFIFVIMVFIVEIYIFILTTNTKNELNPLSKKIRN